MPRSSKGGGGSNGNTNKSLAVSPPLKPATQNGDTAISRRRTTRRELKEKLHTDPLRDYQSSRFSYYGEIFVQNLPMWRLWTARMMLTSDPIVNFSLNIRNAALMAAEVVVTAKNPRVQEWVQKQWDYLWDQQRPKLISAKKWGFAALQPLYKEDDNGLMTLKGLKDFAPEDCRALERRNSVIGCRVKGIEVFFPQSLWLSFGAEFGGAYGTAVTRRQYPAWYEKWMERGAKRLQQLRMIKDAYIGDIFWYPPGMLIELPNGQKLSWKDVMREIGENRYSGGALTLPRLLDNNGKELTGYQPPATVPGATEIFNWVETCDDNILRGADIPSEVVQAADTGSGFSGRSIPFLVLLSVCTAELVEIVQQVDERILRPVAWLNFGGDPEYEITPKSLVESFSADISGSSLGGSSIGGPVTQQPGQPAGAQAPQQYDEIKDQERPHEYKLLHHEDPVDGKYSTTIKARNLKTGKWDTHGSELDPEHAKRVLHSRGIHSYKEEHYHWDSATKKHVKSSQHSEKPAEEKVHEYSCLLFNLPGDLAYEVRQVGDMIPHTDLAEDGKELNPHVTIKFGLHTNDAEEVRKEIQDLSPVAIQIGKASCFKADTHDVVKLDILSDGLHDLNGRVSERLECTDTYPDYKPHITLAYVKPGLGEHYAKRLNLLEGRVASFDRAIFSDKKRVWYPIKLLGSAQFDELTPSHAHYSGKHQFVFKKGKEEVGEISVQPRADGHHEVSNVLVWPKHQRQGHATTFYKHAWEHAKSLGKKLYISNDRTHDAWKLHSKFTERGVLKPDGEIDFSSHQHSEDEQRRPFAGAFQYDEAESILTRLRRFISRGKEAAKLRITSLAKRIRELDPLAPLRSLGDIIEAEIRRLTPFLSSDLISDALPSAISGQLELLNRIPGVSIPTAVEGSSDTPTMPTEVSHNLPILPELTKILFGDIPEVSPPETRLNEPLEPTIDLPFIKVAVEAIESAPPAVGATYKETAQLVRDGAFAITGDLTEKAVADVRDQLAKTIQDGRPQADFIKVVAERLEVEGSPLSPAHIENVFRTNTMSAYSRAQYDVATTHPMVMDAFPYVKRSATRDARVRPEHWALESLGLNGTAVYRVDDPVWQKFRAPWHYNCRCRDTYLSVDQAAKAGVEEAQAWIERAKGIAQAQGGSFYQYLLQSAPATGEHVAPPDFEPSPEFRRDSIGG